MQIVFLSNLTGSSSFLLKSQWRQSVEKNDATPFHLTLTQTTTAIDRKCLTREVSRVTSCAQRRRLRLQSDHRCLVGNYTHADTQRPALPWREGKHWAPSASSARCQSKEIAPPEWKLKSSVFLIEPNAGLISQESELWLFHLPAAVCFFIKGNEWSVTANPWIPFEGLFLFIYPFYLFFFFGSSNSRPLCAFPESISGSQRKKL